MWRVVWYYNNLSTGNKLLVEKLIAREKSEQGENVDMYECAYWDDLIQTQ